jgi:hypothetical protein
MNSGLTTPEINARSRKNLEGFLASSEDEKGQQMEMMTETEHFIQQHRELEELKEAL